MPQPSSFCQIRSKPSRTSCGAGGAAASGFRLRGGYQVGGFPNGWSEWNDIYRKTLRRYWIGEANLLGDVAHCMTGSAGQFQHGGRGPRSGINLSRSTTASPSMDLVSYEQKHNEANGEDNRDGSDDNASTNCGIEGSTDDPAILKMRRQLRRNQLACLLLAQGVPLLLAGDEVSNGQGGNNNAYAQDNETGWVDWSKLGSEDEFTSFVSLLSDLRRRFPQLKPRHWLEGKRADGSYDIKWLTPAGAEMAEADWNFAEGRFLSYVLAPEAEGGQPLFIILNAAQQPVEFTLPGWSATKNWTNVLDTGENGDAAGSGAPGTKLTARSLTVLAFAGRT